METRKQMILDALDAFVRQRSGMDYRNYYQNWTDKAGVAACRADYRSITRDLHDYRALRLVVGLWTDITADDLRAAFQHAFSGRLTLTAVEHNYLVQQGPEIPTSCGWDAVKLDYCIGQYFPTEYRKAACAVMASALWARKRLDMPAAIGYRVESWAQLGKERTKGTLWETRYNADVELTILGGQQYGSVTELYPDNLPAGDWLRASFRKEFGRGLASRYFS